MPFLARKLLICAAVEGIVLQPLTSKKDQSDQRPPLPLRLKYGDAAISSISRDQFASQSKSAPSFEAFGIVGLITVSQYSYLVSITRRQQVATIRGSPIYVITEVALTPCTSHKEASDSVTQTAEHLRVKPAEQEDDSGSDTDGEAEAPETGSDEIGDESASEVETTRGDSKKGSSSVAQDVMYRRGSYGRFATRWFSKSGWTQDQKRKSGLSDRAVRQAVDDAAASGGTNETSKIQKTVAGNEESPSDVEVTSLLPKFLRTTQIYFGSSRSFFFAYDYDLTQSLARNQQSVQASSTTPLYKMVDPLYFWNRHALQPFIEAGAEGFALPLMQGFVGQRSFVVDSHPPQVDSDAKAKDSMEMNNLFCNETSDPPSPAVERKEPELRGTERKFDVTLISRRSVKRAGLRYLRRGVDEEGNVANSVETEQILSPSTPDPALPIYSFLQVRGSIPLYFTQTPYSLKPVPVLHHSSEANYAALKRHFDSLHQRYTNPQIVNLVEKGGTEGKLGKEYEQKVQRLNEENDPKQAVPFEWFDFHHACRGMKFENVSQVVDTLSKKVESMGSTIEKGGKVASTQGGVLRTNCMDCLDRTNVCQSSFGKYMLDLQLKEQGFDMAAQRDLDNMWFNTLWADNGDAISKQYASTGAMKGDYTRTRKRDYRGALNDLGLSLTRFYNSMVNDFFLQATIDFLQGNVTHTVFEEFESDMMTKDPAVSMQKMREQAIELSQKRVVEDQSEEFIGGWTMLSPHTPNSVHSHPFEEVILLLTDAALYLCRFDWTLDKVSSFERVQLSQIQGIRFGTYVTSTVSPTQMDENKNVGIVVTYRPGASSITRTNTRSISSAPLPKSSGSFMPAAPAGLAGLLTRRPDPEAEKRIALKALYSRSSMAVKAGEPTQMTELQQVVSICSEIERLTLASKPHFTGSGKAKTLIEKADIISVAEAKKSAGPLEYLGHSIKKMIWAS